MKVLWITNTIFPDLSKELGTPEPFFGGWMYGLAKKLSKTPGIFLGVATVYPGKDLKCLEIKGIVYFLLPSVHPVNYKKELEGEWKKVLKGWTPDLIHIHGTEYAHGLACMRSSPQHEYVVSIQGIVSSCSKYYYAGISFWEILKNVTFRDIVKLDSIINGKKKFQKRGQLEKEYFQRANHVIGRTEWDFANSRAFNNRLNYHFCNESLREEFYSAEKWDIERKECFSIFLSQASYPLKGLHQVIKAVAILKKDFPKIKIRIAGRDITKNESYIDKIKLSGYGAYLRDLVERFDLHGMVSFVGPLGKERMIEEYRNAHLFICPSSIENSPNSLGEAQLLGVPTISAYVGGIPDMVVHGESGLLYRFEEVEMLAENIRNIFTNNSLAKHLSENGIKSAEVRHCPLTNLQRTLEIYDSITSSKECGL